MAWYTASVNLVYMFDYTTINPARLSCKCRGINEEAMSIASVGRCPGIDGLIP